jgi:hypothetical protein
VQHFSFNEIFSMNNDESSLLNFLYGHNIKLKISQCIFFLIVNHHSKE